MNDDRLYFRQLLSGRDFAVGDQMATQMVNFAYLIGDRQTGDLVIVDPAYAVKDLIEVAAFFQILRGDIVGDEVDLRQLREIQERRDECFAEIALLQLETDSEARFFSQEIGSHQGVVAVDAGGDVGVQLAPAQHRVAPAPQPPAKS